MVSIITDCHAMTFEICVDKIRRKDLFPCQILQKYIYKRNLINFCSRSLNLRNQVDRWQRKFTYEWLLFSSRVEWMTLQIVWQTDCHDMTFDLIRRKYFVSFSNSAEIHIYVLLLLVQDNWIWPRHNIFCWGITKQIIMVFNSCFFLITNSCRIH